MTLKNNISSNPAGAGGQNDDAATVLLGEYLVEASNNIVATSFNLRCQLLVSLSFW